MKTAISIEDGLLQEADATAKRLRLSRSGLFALAVSDFLERQRREQMLIRLNEVYAADVGPAEKPVLAGIKAKVRRTVKPKFFGSAKASIGREKACRISRGVLLPTSALMRSQSNSE